MVSARSMFYLYSKLFMNEHRQRSTEYVLLLGVEGLSRAGGFSDDKTIHSLHINYQQMRKRMISRQNIPRYLTFNNIYSPVYLIKATGCLAKIEKNLNHEKTTKRFVKEGTKRQYLDIMVFLMFKTSARQFSLSKTWDIIQKHLITFCFEFLFLFYVLNEE